MYDLNAIRVYVKVVENEGFTAATERLQMPKSKISRIISRLEDDLGTRLLERTTRQIRLTESGRLFYQYSQRIIEEAEQAELAMQAMNEQVSGLLRISASLSVGQNLLGQHVSTFLTQYPDIEIDLDLSNRRVDLVEENFDVAIRIGTLNNSSLVSMRLGTTHSYLYANRRFIQEYGQPKLPEDLKKYKILCMSSAVPKNQITLLDTYGNKEKIKMNFPIKVNDFNTLKHLAKNGIGIAMLPAFMCNQENELDRIMPDWQFPSAPVYVVYPSHRGATPKLRAFIDFLNSEIRPLLASHANH